MRPTRAPRRRALVGLAATLAASTALVGLSHVPSVRALFGVTSCPFEPGARAASPETLEAFRTKSLASLRAGGAAPTRPALAFALGATRRDEVRAWAAARGLACGEELGGAALRCEGATPRLADASGGEIRDAYFRFGPDGPLVAADIVHTGTSAVRAAAIATRLSRELEQELGAKARVRGEATAEHLGAGRFSRVGFELRFGDYAADVSATSFAADDTPRDREVVVREQYRSLAPLATR